MAEEKALISYGSEQLPATLEESKKQTDLIIQRAAYWAKSMMELVEKCGMSKNLGGKKYLEVEGWQLIAEFAHVKPVVQWVREWKDEAGTMIGYECRVQLFNDSNEIVGAGESSCGLDAFPCRGKSGSEKDKAAKSAAQTWATSRALRNKFSFVAKIAGYEPAPAEEMSREEGPAEQRQQPPPKPPPVPQVISEPQRKRLWAICQSHKIAESKIRQRLELYGIKSMHDITRGDMYDELCKWAEAGGPTIPDPHDEIPEYDIPENWDQAPEAK